MAAPSFVTEVESTWNVDNTSPKTPASITTQVGDVLVVSGASENNSGILLTPTNTGTAETFTLQQSITAFTSYCSLYIWTAVCATAQTTSISVAKQTPANYESFGCAVVQYRGSNGVGASNQDHVTTGAAAISLTTTGANSAVYVVSADWNAVDGTSRTWLTVNSSTGTERSYSRNAATFTLYANTYADVGAAGAKSVGLSAPTGQAYVVAAVEVLGAAAAPFAVTTPSPRYR